MWRGMTGDDYELIPGGIRHQPTGVTIDFPAPVQWTLPELPHVVTSTGAHPFVAEFDIQPVPTAVHALRLGRSYQDAENHERFLSTFGRLSTLESVRARPGSIPWDKQLIDVIAILYFIEQDLAGFARGEPAHPDKLEVVAREVPKHLRGIIVNPFARDPVMIMPHVKSNSMLREFQARLGRLFRRSR